MSSGLGAHLAMSRRNHETARSAIGLEVQAPDHPVSQEDRKHIIAMLPLVRWRVDLQPVAEAEKPLRAVAVENQGIEGRQQAAAREPHRHFRVAGQESLSAPGLDLHRNQVAGGDEVGDASLHIRYGQAEIGREIANRRDSQSLGRYGDEAALCVASSRRRQGQDLGRQDALRQVVDALESSAPCRNPDLAAPEQIFERQLAFAPAPPRAARRGRAVEIGCGQRSSIRDFGQDSGDPLGLLTGKAGNIPQVPRPAAASSMRQRSRGCRATGSREASCPQYSNSCRVPLQAARSSSAVS